MIYANYFVKKSGVIDKSDADFGTFCSSGQK